MKKTVIVNQEVPFKFDELFFSTTDRRGIIKFGNDVFVSISGYPQDTIIGAPHNIIRHPDMPRSVFKLFWDTIKSNRPIGAYIKNLAADGRYYWVFAFAFPVEQGYLSIRFKPSSDIFSKVQEIYQSVLEFERNHELDESLDFLNSTIQSAGFSNYETFMTSAAIIELNARDKQVEKIALTDSIGNSQIQDISEVTASTSSRLDSCFSKVDQFQKGNDFFSKSVHLLNDEFAKLKFLSINMKVLAGNFGDQAATLSVISEEFSKLANKIEEQIKTFSLFAEQLNSVIEHCSLHLAALKTQMIMVDYFVKESIQNLNHDKDAFAGMISNQDIFTNLFSNSIKQLNEELGILKSRLNFVTDQIKEIQKLISGLEVIKQTGAIESARKDEVKKSFDYYLTEMDSFIDFLRKTIGDLNHQKESLTRNTNEIKDSTEAVAGNIHQVFQMALLNQ